MITNMSLRWMTMQRLSGSLKIDIDNPRDYIHLFRNYSMKGEFYLSRHGIHVRYRDLKNDINLRIYLGDDERRMQLDEILTTHRNVLFHYKKGWFELRTTVFQILDLIDLGWWER